MPRISSKNQVTLPARTLERAGLRSGDEVTIEADGPDRVLVRCLPVDPAQALGVFDGLYPPGYLDDLRAGEWA